jgi:PBP1b-binding outer membrane lipoprotein LpoB
LKQAATLSAILPLVYFLAAGCSTPDSGQVKSGRSEPVVVTMQFDSRDANVVADTVVRGLLESGVFDKVSQPPGVLAIQHIANNTRQSSIGVDTIAARIRTALLASGKVLLVSPDIVPSANTVQPNLCLNGRISESMERTGNMRRTTFTADFWLTDTKGIILWEGEKEIGKQGTRSAVGF